MVGAWIVKAQGALIGLLRSQPATEFYAALTFWDAKRPITAKLLNQLDLAALAKRLDRWSDDLARVLTRRPDGGGFEQPDLLGGDHQQGIPHQRAALS